jgi:hypothetical protein
MYAAVDESTPPDMATAIFTIEGFSQSMDFQRSMDE